MNFKKTLFFLIFVGLLFLLAQKTVFAQCEDRGGIQSSLGCTGVCRDTTFCDDGRVNCSGYDCNYLCNDGQTVSQTDASACECKGCPVRTIVNYCGGDICCDSSVSDCNHVTCPSGQECGGCWCQTVLVTPTPPPGQAGCDSGCGNGVCGYRNADGSCTTDNSCCHRECQGGTACTTVSGAGRNYCDTDSQCSSAPVSTPTPTPACPTAATNLSPNGDTACGVNSVTLTWNKMRDATSYDIRLRDSSCNVDSASPVGVSNNCGGAMAGCSARRYDVCVNGLLSNTYCRGNSCSLTVNVTAGNSYSWWLHSRGDVSCPENQSNASLSVPICTGTLQGQIWDDTNCSQTYNAGESYIQNGVDCGASYTTLLAYVDYTGPPSGISLPNICSPGPYYSVNIPPGTYTVSVHPLSGWQATTPPSSVAITTGNTTTANFGIFTCPTFTTPTITAPLNNSCIQPGATTLSWTAVPGATKYTVRIDRDYSSWSGSFAGVCPTVLNPGDTCTEVTTNSYSYTFEPGHAYRWWVGAVQYCGLTACDGSYAEAYVTTPGCTAQPNFGAFSFTFGQTGPQNFTVNPILLSQTCGTIKNVAFSSSNQSQVEVTPTTTTASPYLTAITAKKETGVNPVIVTGSVYLDPGAFLGCSANTEVTVNPALYWFQVRGGDVHAQANIQSKVPSTIALDKYFSLPLDGYPGLVTYYGNDPIFGCSMCGVSSTGWLAKSSLVPPSTSYDYFYKRSGSPTTAYDCTATNPPTAAGFYLVDGDCNFSSSGSSVDFGTNKVVVFVNGNLNINRELTYSNGGFLAFIVKGDIEIDPTVGNNPAAAPSRDNPNISGVYLAGGTFKTNEGDTNAHARFVGKGVFKAQSFTLRRDLAGSQNAGNDEYPAELFIFDPSLAINAPIQLWSSNMSWLEVTP